MTNLTRQQSKVVRWGFIITIIWIASYIIAIGPFIYSFNIPTKRMPVSNRYVLAIDEDQFYPSFNQITINYSIILGGILIFWFITKRAESVVKNFQATQELTKYRIWLAVLLTVLYNVIFLILVLGCLHKAHLPSEGVYPLVEEIKIITNTCSKAISFLITAPIGYFFGVESMYGVEKSSD